MMAKFSLKHFSSLGLLVLPFVFNTSLNAQTYTDPVGVVKMEIAAAASASQPTFSYLSASMSSEIAYQGTVSAGTTGTITISNDDWTTNQFSAEPHYVIVASGTREGELLDIASNTQNTLTLEGIPASEDQSDLVGQTIQIHKHNTIASIFGANPEAGTVQKGGPSMADQISIYNPITKAYEIYFYNTSTNPLPVGGVFHEGWVNSTDLTTNAAATPIYPDDGFIYKRLATSNFTVNVSGTVIMKKIKVPLVEGYNLICVPYPVDKSKTLNNSTLRPENDIDFDINTHLAAGGANDADQVLIFNPITNQFDVYFYNNTSNSLPVGGSFHQGWVNSTDLTTDASSTPLPTGAGFFILRKTGRPAFNWNFEAVAQ